MYFWGLVKKVVQQVEDLFFFLLFLLFYKKVKKSEKKYKKVFSTFPDVLKALLVLHCNLKLALYYVQQSGAASQRSVQTCIPLCMCCYTCRLGRLWAVLVHVAFIWVWGHRSPVTLIFLPTPPRKPSSESYSSSIERYIELWMTNSVSLGSNPDVFERSVVLRLSYLSPIFSGLLR